MTYFNRYPTTEQTQMGRISDAYKRAGIAEPNRTLAIAELIKATPTAAQVTDQLAQDALTATNAQKFYTDALAAIRDAQAGDAFRETFASRLIAHAIQNMRGTLERTVEDITPAVTKFLEQFKAAAKKLPTANPLDMEANVEAGTANDYKTVRDSLATLGHYVSIYGPSLPEGVPVGLNRILPAVDLPNAAVEQVTGFGRTTCNEPDLTHTRTIRALATLAARDADLALIAVARGDYPGISLSLATPEALGQRNANAHTAHAVESIENGTVR